VTLVEGSETRVSYDVHCVAPAGLEDARLVLASADFADLALAIVGGVELAANLYTLSLNGGAEGPVTTDGWNFHPAVSADGSTIAFTRGTDVYAMDADGLNPRRITNDGQSTDPSWSPDGMRIVYRFGDRLRILRLDDGEILSLATPFGAREPVWSPDGSRIAFSSPGGIYTIAPDGGEAVLEAAGGRAPVWAPVAGRLAYAKEGSVYVIGLNDEEGARLVPGSQGMWMTPTDWSPDGEWIAVNRGTVYLLHVENGTTVRATLDDRCDAVFVPGA
jgi:Tol biopolymer transport system component